MNYKNKIIIITKYTYLIIIILAIFILASCSSKKSENVESIKGKYNSYPIKSLNKEVFIGVDDHFGKDYLSSIFNIAVGINDEIIVFDQNARCFFIIDKNKNLLKKFGQSGQGPGEFNWNIEFSIGNDGDIYVLDKFNVRMSIFDNNGKLKNIFRIDKLFYYSLFTVTQKREIVLNNPSNGYYISVFSDNGKLLKTIGKILEINNKIPQYNTELATGLPYYDENQEIYYVFLYHYNYILLFDKNGNLIRKYDTAQIFPEIKKFLDNPRWIPPEKDTRIRKPSYFSSVTIQNDTFYFCVLDRKNPDDNTIHTSLKYFLYRTDKDMNITAKYSFLERKIERLPDGRTTTIIDDQRFAVSRDGNTVYITDKFICEIWKYNIGLK